MATLSFHAPTQRFDAGKALEHLNRLHAASQELSLLVNGGYEVGATA
jgi:hypothetical protein